VKPQLDRAGAGERAIGMAAGDMKWRMPHLDLSDSVEGGRYR
jgi:hypothetical protein